MSDDLVCWRCGAELSSLPFPFSRTAECPKCNADLYVCRMCRWYDPRVSRQCRETVAEEVKNKERANFCGYYQARPNAYQARDDSAEQSARAQLDALFGGGPSEANSPTPDAARDALEDLFRKPGKSDDGK